MQKSLRILLDGIVDYAGLFPPAALAMEDAVNQYNSYLSDPDRFMLARFVLPASKLQEFNTIAAPFYKKNSDSSSAVNDRLVENVNGDPKWRLSALVGADAQTDVESIERFNSANSGLAVVDVTELKADSPEAARNVLNLVPSKYERFVEVPATMGSIMGATMGSTMGSTVSSDPDNSRNNLYQILKVVKDNNAYGKIRTGGIVKSAFPEPSAVARFILTCAELQLAFKATAGLHHPIRDEYRLTYDPNPEFGVMYGYLNVFIASVIAWDGGTEEQVIKALTETDISAFQFTDDGLQYGKFFSNDLLAAVRGKFANSFGSCSFREPVDDLVTLGLKG